jgi:transcription initiation factor TFIID subunit 10
MAATAWQEEAHKEAANIEKFLKGMSEYPPPIPDAVMMRVLSEAGLATSDPRVHRTLNVACQKFIDDVLRDCLACAKKRVKKNSKGGSSKKGIDLQVPDLKIALGNRGIHVHRPEFIVSIPKTSLD